MLGQSLGLGHGRCLTGSKVIVDSLVGQVLPVIIPGVSAWSAAHVVKVQRSEGISSMNEAIRSLVGQTRGIVPEIVRWSHRGVGAKRLKGDVV